MSNFVRRTMPTCVVPGCTSGYASNPEKLHFFTIPKNPEIKNAWKSVLKRTDSLVDAGRAVCEKHFRKDEILWKRELIGGDGQVLGVTQYKIPRLKKGTIPSQFPWTVETGETTCENAAVGDSGPHIAVFVSRHEQKIVESLNEENIVPANVDNTSHQDIILEPEPEATSSKDLNKTAEIKSALSFADLALRNLCLPSGWMKQVTVCERTNLIIFFKLETLRIAESFQTCIQKNITMTENMRPQITVMNRNILPNNFGVPDVINNIEQMEAAISTIHRFNVCRGCPGLPSDISNYSTLKKDIFETWRHTACSMLLREKKICENCKRASNTVHRNLRRHMENKSQEQDISMTDLTMQKQETFKLLSRYRLAVKAKRLAQQKVKRLDIQEKIAQCDNNNLQQYLGNGNIPKNHVHVLTQIIESAKDQNSEGRNYSEEI